MKLIKTIQPLEPQDGTRPSLINVTTPTTPPKPQDINPMSPDELDRADRLARQKANDKVAKSLLGEISQKERDKLIANTIGSQVGNLQTTSYYEVQVADQVGFPYFTFFFVSILLGLLAWKFEWLSSLESIFAYAAGLYFIYLWLRHWFTHRKRK